MRSYLLSWLTRQHASSDARTFEEKFSGSWLVWEAGPWRPPQDGRTTLFATGRKAPSPSEEALALQIAPRAGKPRFEGVQLGRGRENDLVIEDATLSRAHLLFRFDGENCTVEDLGSSNGTLRRSCARARGRGRPCSRRVHRSRCRTIHVLRCQRAASARSARHALELFLSCLRHSPPGEGRIAYPGNGEQGGARGPPK